MAGYPAARTYCHMPSRRFRPREQLAVLIGLGVTAILLAGELSVEALNLLRERSQISGRAMAARIDELARTVALRTEYQLLTPIATALGRAVPGAKTADLFSRQVRQELAGCECMPSGG